MFDCNMCSWMVVFGEFNLLIILLLDLIRFLNLLK